MSKSIIGKQLDRYSNTGVLEFYDSNQALRSGTLTAFDPLTGICTFTNALGEVFQSLHVR